MPSQQVNCNFAFIPTDSQLKSLIPEGNKACIKKLDTNEWLFGTKKFAFNKDIQGNVYAKTKDDEVLFADFITTYEQLEIQKAHFEVDPIKLQIEDDDSQEFDDADCDEVGEEYERIEESNSCIASKIRHC